MAPKDVGVAACLGTMKAYACWGQLCFVQVHGAVHAFVQALSHRLFHFLRLVLVLLQALKSRLPLCQFSVGQRDVLDDGIALVFVLKLGSMPFDFRCMQELALRRIENRTLWDGICHGGAGSFRPTLISIG